MMLALAAGLICQGMATCKWLDWESIPDGYVKKLRKWGTAIGLALKRCARGGDQPVNCGGHTN
jgi:hypothetical protein